MGSSPRSIWSRKLDLLYLIFFVVHVPVMFCVDLTPLYPTSIKPTFMLQLREYYINTYRDRFFTHPTAFFNTFMALELLYHVPVAFWSIPAIIRDDPLVPLQLLVFALETAITTLVCTVEMFNWEGYTREEQNQLAGLYVPYLVLAVIMGGDMFLRLRKTLLTAHGLGNEKKTR